MFTYAFIIIYYLFLIFVLIYIIRNTRPKLYDFIYIPRVESLFLKVEDLFAKEINLEDINVEREIEKNKLIPHNFTSNFLQLQA